MSDDLIRRSDAIGACAYETIECYEARKAIRALPSADRPQGEWIDKGWKGDWQFETDGRGSCWRVFECSVCNGWTSTRTCFCPHCGAKMKGAEDEM